MGIDHERIHIETSSVLIRQLPIQMVNRPMGWVIAPKMHCKYYKVSGFYNGLTRGSGALDSKHRLDT